MLDKESRILNLCLGSPTVSWGPLAPEDPLLECAVPFLWGEQGAGL